MASYEEKARFQARREHEAADKAARHTSERSKQIHKRLGSRDHAVRVVAKATEASRWR